MFGQMMHRPFLVSGLIEHAARNHADTPIVARDADGSMFRYDYARAERRCRQLARVLGALGVQLGERVATLAWNDHRHFELYFAISGSGAICHTINPRLFVEQIVYIVNHAADAVVFADPGFAALLETIAPRCPSVRHWVIMAPAAAMPEMHLGNVHCYETLIETQSDEYAWPVLDERTACSLCYTSGTTGNPKGALYSHRTTIIHSYALALPDNTCLAARDVVMPIVPMFHVNAWGYPYSAAMVGAKLVLPGARLDPASVYALLEDEQVTHTAAVPTVWMGLLDYLRREKKRLSSLQRLVVGGSACPRALSTALREEYGIDVIHAWGMTETSPMGVVASLKFKHADQPAAAQREVLSAQGRPSFGVELKVVGDDGAELPRDGTSAGDLMIRGAWVIDSYYGNPPDSALRDGWFHTGDVATLDADGYMRITDRSKDVVKSGGEWISSIELENVAMAHPAIAEAAVIAMPHPKWDERPVVIAVKRADATIDKAALLAFFEGKVAKWWVPDDVIFVESLPHTATGKVAKLQLREQYAVK